MKLIKILFLIVPAIFFSQSHKVSAGKIIEYNAFNSKLIGERTIRVWLPRDYSPEKKYQVLYANDGQMLWDSTVTWNHSEWRLDEVLNRLLSEKKIKPTIVVAIDNADKDRHSEYFPEKPFYRLNKTLQDSTMIQGRKSGLFRRKIYSDIYLRFLVTELKPFIDRNYSTLPDASHTFVMGSSMGGPHFDVCTMRISRSFWWSGLYVYALAGNLL